MLSQTITASSAEQKWGQYEFIHSPRRNRLSNKKASDLMFVSSNLKLLGGQVAKISVVTPAVSANDLPTTSFGTDAIVALNNETTQLLSSSSVAVDDAGDEIVVDDDEVDVEEPEEDEEITVDELDLDGHSSASDSDELPCPQPSEPESHEGLTEATMTDAATPIAKKSKAPALNVAEKAAISTPATVAKSRFGRVLKKSGKVIAAMSDE